MVAVPDRDLCLRMGKHGQTIDAIQYLANAIVYRGQAEDRKAIVVDAAGYRERRKASLDPLPARAAAAREALVDPRAVRAARAGGRGREGLEGGADDGRRAQGRARAVEGLPG